MTITIAWVRHDLTPPEIVVASDSRLRARGPMDQAQKIYQLARGDCCLSFCGDAQIAYPLFVQVGVALDNHLRTSSRAVDVTSLTDLVEKLLNNLIDSWRHPAKEKAEDLQDTKILFVGWSWRYSKPHIGILKLEKDGRFKFHRAGVKLPHPWRAAPRADLFFLGDYKAEYFYELTSILQKRFPAPAKKQNSKIEIRWDYEPAEALQALLRQPDARNARVIGGAAQVVKVYPFSRTIPLVVRASKTDHFLLGRRLFPWEITDYPILDLSSRRKARVLYPKDSVPAPNHVRNRRKKEASV